MSKQKKLSNYISELIGEIDNDVDEATTTGNAAGYMTPNAFSAGSSKSKKKIKKTSTQAGYEIVGEDIENPDKMPGGLAQGKSLEDIANKHKVDIDILLDEFRKGIKVEMEHTTDKEIAKGITLDHLFENPKYYTKLAAIVNEGAVSDDAYRIHRIIRSGQDATQNFLDSNNIDVKKLISDITKDKLWRFSVADVIGDRAHPTIKKKFDRLYKESVDTLFESMSKYKLINKIITNVLIDKNSGQKMTSIGGLLYYIKKSGLSDIKKSDIITVAKTFPNIKIESGNLIVVNESIAEGKLPIVKRTNRWLKLKNDESMHTHKKLAVGLKELRNQLSEVEKFLGWYNKLKDINELDSDNYWKRTNSNIYKIKERIINIATSLQKIEK